MHFSLIYFTYLQDENKTWHFQKYPKNKICELPEMEC